MTTDLLSRIAVAELVSEWHAVEASVDIVRVARDGDDAVIAARFDNSAGRARRVMFGLREADGEWHRTGGFGGPAPAPGDTEVCWDPGRWSSNRRPIRGFWVAHPGAVALRLTEPAGRSIEGTVENGVAVLIGDGDFPERWAQVELLDADGTILTTGPVWPAPALVG